MSYIFFISILCNKEINIFTDFCINENLLLSRNVSNCDTLINKRQFYIKIDGEVYPKSVPLFYNASIDLQCIKKSQQRKTILMWTKFKGLPLVDLNFGKNVLNELKCPIDNCEITNDRNKLNQSDLVLFHLRNHIDYFPKRELKNQRWVHVIYESPINCHLCDKHENTFNLSATYTIDSDFTSLYYSDSGLYWKENKHFDENKDFHGMKNKLSTALISNCGADNLRMRFIQELSKFMRVDIYGKCGKKCPDNIDCRQYLSENYKFIFLFENSNCRDYITEKFFDTLKYDIVPVVLGAGNYSYYAPKSSYINVLDFETPKSLSDYLLYLESNKTAYNSYFKWKKYLNYDKMHPTNSYLCEMCIQLHVESFTGEIKKKQLNSMKNRYGMNENCYGPDLRFYFEFIKGKHLNPSFYMSPE